MQQTASLTHPSPSMSGFYKLDPFTAFSSVYFYLYFYKFWLLSFSPSFAYYLVHFLEGKITNLSTWEKHDFNIKMFRFCDVWQKKNTSIWDDRKVDFLLRIKQILPNLRYSIFCPWLFFSKCPICKPGFAIGNSLVGFVSTRGVTILLKLTSIQYPPLWIQIKAKHFLYWKHTL